MKLMHHAITATAVCVAVATNTVAQHARFGRIDAYSQKGVFDCRDVQVSPGAQVMDVGWRGKDMARTGATAQARVRHAWREIWIEVTPEADGKLQINFQGEYYRKRSADDIRLVWVDDVQVTGAQLINGDLETSEATGMPQGWFFGGTPSAEVTSQDGRIAVSGKKCIAVWYGCQLRQLLDVHAGQPVRVTAHFRAFAPPSPFTCAAQCTVRCHARNVSTTDRGPPDFSSGSPACTNPAIAPLRRGGVGHHQPLG